jgi:hypothetical protein
MGMSWLHDVFGAATVEMSWQGWFMHILGQIASDMLLILGAADRSTSRELPLLQIAYIAARIWNSPPPAAIMQQDARPITHLTRSTCLCYM